MSDPTASLKVNGKQFRNGLKTATKLLREKETGPVMFGFENGRLSVALESMTVSADAEGEWAGQARVPASMLPLLYESLPDGDVIDLTVHGGQLVAGQSKVPCVWEPPFRRVQIPAGAPLWAILAVPEQYSEYDIRRSGLEDVIENAVETRDRLIEQAAELLAPLGISDDQLRRLSDLRIKGQNS